MGIQELEAAMSALYDLASESSQLERPYQKWIERHTIVTDLLGYVHVLPQPQLLTQRGDGTDKTFTPDLMGQLSNGLWEIIELKRPDTPVLPPGERRRELKWSPSVRPKAGWRKRDACSDFVIIKNTS